jgi:hypothetical protein
MRTIKTNILTLWKKYIKVTAPGKSPLLISILRDNNNMKLTGITSPTVSSGASSGQTVKNPCSGYLVLAK